mgnify:CR=1 FL=1
MQPNYVPDDIDFANYLQMTDAAAKVRQIGRAHV